MSESTVLSIRPVRTHTVTLPGTSSSGTIADVGIPDFSTGRRSRSTTSILTGSSQPELTINRLSGKLGAHQTAAWTGVVYSGPSGHIAERKLELALPELNHCSTTNTR